MSTPAIALDTGPLGLVIHPKGGIEAAECKAWLEELLSDGCRIIVPAISDYELRRELIRGGLSSSIDALIRTLDYLPIDQDIWNEAAEIWARARQSGKPTAPDLALDGDCILAAQSWNIHKVLYKDRYTGEFYPMIATTNPGHLTRFANAMHWRDIPRWYGEWYSSDREG